MRRPSWLRALVWVAGAGLGAVGVLLYLLEQKRREETVAEEPAAQAPQQAITIKPDLTRTQQAAPVLVDLEAIPDPLVRGEAGTIRLRTSPKATCTIEARYSTGRTPSSLDAEPKVVDASGQCGWTWEIGTSGTHVDVMVQVWEEQTVVASLARRIAVTG